MTRVRAAERGARPPARLQAAGRRPQALNREAAAPLGVHGPKEVPPKPRSDVTILFHKKPPKAAKMVSIVSCTSLTRGPDTEVRKVATHPRPDSAT